MWGWRVSDTALTPQPESTAKLTWSDSHLFTCIESWLEGGEVVGGYHPEITRGPGRGSGQEWARPPSVTGLEQDPRSDWISRLTFLDCRPVFRTRGDKTQPNAFVQGVLG